MFNTWLIFQILNIIYLSASIYKQTIILIRKYYLNDLNDLIYNYENVDPNNYIHTKNETSTIKPFDLE